MRQSFKEVTLGNWDCIEYQDANQSESAPVAVIFHGYGADANDLASLAPALRLPHVRWVFPNGPLSVALGGGFYGRAWFPVDMVELDRAMREGRPRDLAANRPKELDGLRHEFEVFLKELGVPLDKVLLGGFSQGAMLTTDLTLFSEKPPAGIALLSGTMLNEGEWTQWVQRRSGLRFFQSHGRHDQVLGFAFAQRLESLLKSGGLKGQLLPFDGGHEIPPRVLEELRSFMLRVFPAEGQ